MFAKRIAIHVALLIIAVPIVSFANEEVKNPQSAKLQIFNGSDLELSVEWLDDDGSRRPTLQLKPNESKIITTSLGHTHVLVNGQGDDVARVTCRVPIQAFRFENEAQQDISAEQTIWPNNEVLETSPKMNVPGYYSKIIFANGFPVVGSSRVDDFALREAAFLINTMLAERPDIRKALIASGSRMCVMSEDEFTTDLPEFQRLGRNSPMPGIEGRDYWDARARGLGGSETDPYCSCGEENLLCFRGDPYSQENILIHEFAHSIHLRGIANIDADFDRRLGDAYEKAMKEELWSGKYASVNRFEYFAEGVQSWFSNNRAPDHDHNHVDTRQELIDYDPRLADLCKEIFGTTTLEYTKPQTRLKGHLEGFEPDKAPTFQWPARLKNAQRAIQRSAQERNENAGN